MEMVAQYNKANKIERLHYIALESVINRIGESYRGQIKDTHNILKLKDDLEEEMRARHLDRFFQLKLKIGRFNGIELKVQEINIFDKPKECVVWN